MTPIIDFGISKDKHRLAFTHTSTNIVPVGRAIKKIVQDHLEKVHHNDWSQTSIPELNYRNYFVGDKISMVVHLKKPNIITKPAGKIVVQNPLAGAIINMDRSEKPRNLSKLFNRVIKELDKI